MKFYVIYWNDCINTHNVKEFVSKTISENLQRTEYKENYEYDYLAFEEGKVIITVECSFCNYITNINAEERENAICHNCHKEIPEKTIEDAIYNGYCSSKYYHGDHAKYAGFLTKEQFQNCFDYSGLYMEDIETMGLLTEYGWMPAISFQSDNYVNIINEGMYITPIPTNSFIKHLNEEEFEKLSKEEKEKYIEKQERNWNRIYKAMKEKYCPY